MASSVGKSKASKGDEGPEKVKKALRALLKLPENRVCADCPIKGPTWASINIGVFLCLQCSGIHRNLGVHISQVRSTELDTWQQPWYQVMQAKGNEKANEYWEARLPRNYSGKPTAEEAEALSHKLKKFITDKYQNKLWVENGEPSAKPAKSSSSSSSKKKSGDSSSSSDSSSDTSSDSSSSSSSSSSEDKKKKSKKAAAKKKENSKATGTSAIQKQKDPEEDLFGDFSSSAFASSSPALPAQQPVAQNVTDAFGVMSMSSHGQQQQQQLQQHAQMKQATPAPKPPSAGIDLSSLYSQGSGAGLTYARGMQQQTQQPMMMMQPQQPMMMGVGFPQQQNAQALHAQHQRQGISGSGLPMQSVPMQSQQQPMMNQQQMQFSQMAPGNTASIPVNMNIMSGQRPQQQQQMFANQQYMGGQIPNMQPQQMDGRFPQQPQQQAPNQMMMNGSQQFQQPNMMMQQPNMMMQQPNMMLQQPNMMLQQPNMMMQQPMAGMTQQPQRRSSNQSNGGSFDPFNF